SSSPSSPRWADEVEVRARTSADLDGCTRLAEEVEQLDDYPGLPTDLRSFLVSPDALRVWVAEAHGEIVGHVALHSKSSDPVMALAGEATGRGAEGLGVVARLLVAPTARRSGLGRTLLHTAASEAIRQDRWPILDVVTYLQGAIALYEGCGWRRAGQVTVRFDVGEIDEFVYIGPTAT
ncbi:MAG: putative GCN5-related N-acetyltransferase, partial [Acidimicrobiales bacterium]|nr:putative GCN5-related N-acetyltransferase [Acidimicrobiales bacterium]